MSSSSTKTQTAKRKRLPSNITISTAFLGPIDTIIKDLFIGIFHDYCERFRVSPSKKPIHVAIAGVEAGKAADPNQFGLTISTDDRILIHINDPSLEDESAGDLSHVYISVKFVEVVCHEMVHAMQSITNRNPQSFGKIKHDRGSSVESYFFDAHEVEARILESFYTNVFGVELQAVCLDESE